jgi:hypothetical protein
MSSLRFYEVTLIFSNFESGELHPRRRYALPRRVDQTFFSVKSVDKTGKN